MYPFITPEPGAPASSWRRWTASTTPPRSRTSTRARAGPRTRARSAARSWTPPGTRSRASTSSPGTSPTRSTTAPPTSPDRSPKGMAGPDGSFVMNGLTPGASYVLYTDQLLNGAFSVPEPIVLPGPEEYFNGPMESGDGSTDDRCAWSPVAATAGSPVTLDVTFNHLPGAPTFLTAPDLSVRASRSTSRADGGVVVGARRLRWPHLPLGRERQHVRHHRWEPWRAQCGISDDGLKIAANVVDTDGINKAAIYENDAWTILPPVPGAVACDQQQRWALVHAGLRHLGRRFDRGRAVLRQSGVRQLDHPGLQVDRRRRNRGAPQGRRPQQGQPRQRRQLRRIGDRRLGRRQQRTAARRAVAERCSVPDQEEQPVGR